MIHGEECFCPNCIMRVMRNVGNGKTTPFAGGRALRYVMAVQVENEDGELIWHYSLAGGVDGMELKHIVTDLTASIARLAN